MTRHSSPKSRQKSRRRSSSGPNVGLAERLISAAAGGLLLYFGLRPKARPVTAIGLSTLGAGMVLRGASGYCPLNAALGRNSARNQRAEPIEIVQTFTIYRPAEELYSFWRRHENLPRFMHHLEDVRELDERRSHWSARIPGGLGTVEWEAEITAEDPGRMLAWQSLPGSEVDTSGRVTFREAPGDKGTEVQAIIRYRAPGGAIGQAVAHLVNPATAQLVREDMRRFKQLMETGELTTIEGQPSGRGHDSHWGFGK